MKSKQNNQKKKQNEPDGPKDYIKDLYNIIVKSTINDFKEKKEVMPQVLIMVTQSKKKLNDKRILVVPLEECIDVNERCSVLNIVAKRLKEENVVVNATISIFEAWMSIIKDNGTRKKNTILSQDSNKKEALVFSAIDKKENNIHSVYQIIRSGEDIELKTIENHKNFGTWLSKKDEKDTIENNILLSFWNTYNKSSSYT